MLKKKEKKKVEVLEGCYLYPSSFLVRSPIFPFVTESLREKNSEKMGRLLLDGQLLL